MISIGLMSGTSMDGIDAALLNTDGDGLIDELGSTKITYSKETKCLLKSAERAISNANGDMTSARLNYPKELKAYLTLENDLDDLKVIEQIEDLTNYFQNKNYQTLNLDNIIHHSTMLHAEIVNNLLLQSKTLKIDVIGYHGQTMYHNPSKKISLQIGDGALLANLTNTTVVSNFRTKDVEAGGEGAPFAPLYHQALARRDKKIPLVVVNCGGIANISLIKDDKIENLIGFDSGPGNALIDAFVKKRTSGTKFMDHDGQYGLLGQVNQEVLDALFAKSILSKGENYYLKPLPKSLDIRDIELISELDSLSLEDGCRTLESFSADMIIKSLDLISEVEVPKYWILAGGGWHNRVIKERLIAGLHLKYGESIKILSAKEAGWNGEALEAQIFAYLAVRSIQHKPLSVPGTTGVDRPTSGGEVYYPCGLMYPSLK